MTRPTLDLDLLTVESFATSSVALSEPLGVEGTWNDATAGCCAPKPKPTPDPGTYLPFCSNVLVPTWHC